MPFSGWDDLNPQFASSLQAMIAAQPGISPFSGYRSPARQAVLYDAAVRKYGSPEAARKWVAPPGSSQHGFRNAVDLHYANDAAREWAHAHAGDYGLTFPMSWENWHIEPIGARGSHQGVGGAGVAPVAPGGQGAAPAGDPLMAMIQQNLALQSQLRMQQAMAQPWQPQSFGEALLAGQNPFRGMAYRFLGELLT
jgi:hypothetical protein